jgi:hypothetical protein
MSTIPELEAKVTELTALVKKFRDFMPYVNQHKARVERNLGPALFDLNGTDRIEIEYFDTEDTKKARELYHEAVKLIGNL